MNDLNGFDLSLAHTKKLGKEFNLNTVAGRKEYFEQKAGDKILAIKKYLETNSFIAYFLAKKGAGKGTYTRQMLEIFGDDLMGHISVGDVIRATHKDLEDPEKKDALMKYLTQNYRGYISLEEALDAILGRSQEKLLPTELTLVLMKREIEKHKGKALFIDGFPRDIDQVSYSFFFRDLIDLRSDPDFFIAIDVPEAVIEERMKGRVVCPQCQSPKQIKLLPTEFVGFDEEKGEYYLMCDNVQCDKARMGGKEGDQGGLAPIRERLDRDGDLIKKIFGLHGIDKILMRNALPVQSAQEYVETYEMTPEFYYEGNEIGKIVTKSKPFETVGDDGQKVISLIAPTVTLQLINQLHTILGLDQE